MPVVVAFFTATHAQTIPPQIVLQKVRDAIEGGTNGLFRVALNYPIPVNENIVITFSYINTLPNATPGTDYTILGLSGVNTMTIPAGATEIFLQADASNDGINEGPETISIQLNTAVSATQSYTIDPAFDSATVLVVDANAVSSTPLQVTAGANGAEPATQAVFTLKLAGVATSAWPVSVAYALSGTSAEGMDYQLADQIIIPPNTNSIQVSVPVINDHVIEPTESLTFTILSGSAYGGGGNAFIFPPDFAYNAITINLADNDNATTNKYLSVTTITDAAEPSSNGFFSVKLSSDYRSSANITIPYALSGTATQNNDYTIGTVTLPAYRNSVQVPVTVINNTAVEPTESVILTIQNGSMDGNGIAYVPSPVNPADTMSIMDDDAPLPLRLLSFTGYQLNGNIQLQWQTSDEQHTDHFEILRSKDGSKFVSVGKVQALGWGGNQYTFIDKQPQYTNFYRLHMVDKDGKATYSPIINLNMDQRAYPTTIYPNPANGSITLTAGNDKLFNTKAIISDALGRLCQTVHITGRSQVISLKHFAPGTYFVKMATGEIIKLILK